MDRTERQRYEGTGHGDTLEARIEGFRKQTASTLPIICAWCQPTPVGVRVSHGICADCAKIFKEGR